MKNTKNKIEQCDVILVASSINIPSIPLSPKIHGCPIFKTKDGYVYDATKKEFTTDSGWFVHIEFRRVNGEVLATTGQCNHLPRIPQSFVKKYIKCNGKIDEVFIKVENVLTLHEYGHDYYERVPKCSNKGEVIIVLPKKDINPEDIPVDAIKELVEYRYNGDSKKNWAYLAASEVEKWLKDNRLY